MGNRNSVKSRVLQKNPSCFIAGCNCHLAHIAAKKGGSAYSKTSKFDIEDHMVDLYYYFKGSTRRKGILTEFLYFNGMEWESLGKYVTTRWLSLEQCVDKELKKFPALKSMFMSRDARTGQQDNGRNGDEDEEPIMRGKRLEKAFSDPMTEVHIAFYVSALSLFTHYNLFLQRADPLAHKVKPMTDVLARKIGMRFLTPDILDEITIKTIEDEENYLPLSNVFVGMCTRNTFRKLLNEGIIADGQYNLMLKAAQEFYKESLKYVLKKMDKSEGFWKHAVWIDFFHRNKANWEDVHYFTEMYKDVLSFSEREYEQLFEEFIDFQTISEAEICLDEAIIEEHEDGTKEYRIDVIWYELQNLKSPIGSNYRFGKLFKVAKIIIITPHSNAGIERVYSLVNKNKPENSDRNRLDVNRSLSSILAVKLGRPESVCKCFDFQPDQKLLKNAKQATRKYNQLHSTNT